MMQRIVLYLIFGMLLTASVSFAQSLTYKEGTPEWIISNMILTGTVPNGKEYLTDEMEVYIDTPLSVGDTKDLALNIRRLPNSGPIVYTSHVRSPYGESDFYWFFEKEGDVDRLVAFRSLAQTWLYAYFVEHADSMLTSDALSDSARKQLVKDVANAKLVLASDSALKEYFKANRSSIEQLRTMYSSGSSSESPSEEAQKLIDALHLSSVSVNPGYVQIVIGGILDNTVGYLYLSDPDQSPPQMTGRQWIYVEEIAPRWYIFKTT